MPNAPACTYLESDSEDWLATHAIPTTSDLDNGLPHVELTLQGESNLIAFRKENTHEN